MTARVMGFFEQITHRSGYGIAHLQAADAATVDVAAQLEDMW
jgi:hypothetical protein